MKTRKYRGITTSLVLVLIVLLGIAGFAVWLMGAENAPQARSNEADIFEARRGSFEIVIPTTGELASRRRIEIRNEMEERATITYIVDEGINAEAGDVLIRFNDEDLRNRIKDAEDALDNAVNQLENAKANLEIRKKTRESELAKADLEITLTELALQSWEDGEVVESRQNLQLELKTAQMEYDRLQERFEASKRLYGQEFISLDEYKQDEIALVRAETRLKQAQLDIEIYEKYEYEQQREQKESDRQQAIEERDRIQQRLDAEVRSAESDVRSAERLVDSRRERLEKWEQQLELCEVRAPAAGLVVYASSIESDRRRDEEPPTVGTEVSPKRTVMVLPDVSEMTADVKVNEALSGLIEAGQPVTIVTDARPDLVLAGHVTSVGVLAETGGWRDPNRRDYTVTILLDDYDRSLGLKPAMRCKANINVGRVTDSIYVPIQAVRRQGPTAYVWTPDGGGFSQREVGVGQASELYVEITGGLEAGDRVLLREPQTSEVASTLNLPEGGATGTPEMASNAPDGQGAMGQRPETGNRSGNDRAGATAGRGRPSPEQIKKMMENMTPEQRAEMQKRIEAFRNRQSGGGNGQSGAPEDSSPREE